MDIKRPPLMRILTLPYILFLLVGVGFISLSVHLNHKAFINNRALYETIVGEREKSLIISSECLQQLKKQLENARLAGTDTCLTNRCTLLLGTPYLFVKKIQNLVYMHTVVNDYISITSTRVNATVVSGTRRPVRLTLHFIRQKEKLLLVSLIGLDSLLVEVNRAIE